GDHRRVTVYQVIRLHVGRRSTPIIRHQVFEKFYPWSIRRTKAGDSQMCTLHKVEVGLLGSIVVAHSGNSESQDVAIKLQSCVGIEDYDCSVVDTKKQIATLLVPLSE